MQMGKISLKNWSAIIAISLLNFIGLTIQTGQTIAIPKIMSQFSVPINTVQLISSGYSLAVAIIIMLSAFFSQRFSTRLIFSVSCALFFLGLLMSGFASQFFWLFLGRLIQGVAAGLALPLTYNLIVKKVPAKIFGTVIGIATLIITLGPAIGPIYGSVIVANFNWRYIYIFMIPFLLLTFFLGWFSITSIQSLSKVKLDIPSVIFMILFLTGYLFGLSSFSKHSVNPILTWGSLIGAIFFTVLYIHRSLRISQPLINLSIFKNFQFRRQLVAYFISQMAAMSVGFMLPNYLQIVDHVSAGKTGLVIFPGALLSALIAPLSGKWLDKFGARKVLTIGTIIYVSGLGLFVLLNDWLTVAMITLVYLIFMWGIGMVTGNLMTSGLFDLNTSQKEDGTALFNTAQQFAGAIGTAIVSSIIAFFQTGPTQTLNDTKEGVFISFSVLFVLGIVAFVSTVLSFSKNSS